MERTPDEDELVAAALSTSAAELEALKREAAAAGAYLCLLICRQRKNKV